MQKITIFGLVVVVALVAATLVGVGLAQLTTPNPTSVQQTPAPWDINGNPNGAAPYCYGATGTAPTYGPYGTAAGYCVGPQAQSGYAYGAQGAAQNWFGGMMGGRGMMGRGW